MSARSEGQREGRHVGDVVELYALGALEPDERALVEAHLGTCALCSGEMAAAEATVAAMIVSSVERVAPPAALGERIASAARALPGARASARRWSVPSILATAASLALAAGLGSAVLSERTTAARQAAADSMIISTLARSHFLHVGLTPRIRSAPVSKAIYARDGSWLYLVIDSADCGCRVVAHGAGGEHDLGEPVARGTTSTLFVGAAGRPDAIALIGSSGSLIANAPLAYGSP